MRILFIEFLSNTLISGSNNDVELGWIYKVTDPNPLKREHTTMTHL